MKFSLRTLLICLVAAATTVDSFAPAAVRTLSVRSLPSTFSASSPLPKQCPTLLQASTAADAAPAEEPEAQGGGGTATISQYVFEALALGVGLMPSHLCVSQSLSVCRVLMKHFASCLLPFVTLCLFCL